MHGRGYRCKRVGESDALLKEEPGPQVQAPAVPPRLPDATPRSVSPTDQELDRALDVMERFLRRFMAIVREQSRSGPDGQALVIWLLWSKTFWDEAA